MPDGNPFEEGQTQSHARRLPGSKRDEVRPRYPGARSCAADLTPRYGSLPLQVVGHAHRRPADDTPLIVRERPRL
jgi:hypothetical protein